MCGHAVPDPVPAGGRLTSVRWPVPAGRQCSVGRPCCSGSRQSDPAARARLARLGRREPRRVGSHVRVPPVRPPQGQLPVRPQLQVRGGAPREPPEDRVPQPPRFRGLLPRARRPGRVRTRHSDATPERGCGPADSGMRGYRPPPPRADRPVHRSRPAPEPQTRTTNAAAAAPLPGPGRQGRHSELIGCGRPGRKGSWSSLRQLQVRSAPRRAQPKHPGLVAAERQSQGGDVGQRPLRPGIELAAPRPAVPSWLQSLSCRSSQVIRPLELREIPAGS